MHTHSDADACLQFGYTHFACKFLDAYLWAALYMLISYQWFKNFTESDVSGNEIFVFSGGQKKNLVVIWLIKWKGKN